MQIQGTLSGNGKKTSLTILLAGEVFFCRLSQIAFQKILTTTVIPPKSARESPENRIPFKALNRCMSFPTDVLSLARLMTKKISAVMVQRPLTMVPIILKLLKNPESSEALGGSESEITAPPGMVIVDACAETIAQADAQKAVMDDTVFDFFTG